MNSFFSVLLGNLLLKQGPQNFPYSIVLMRLCLVVYFITGLPGLVSNVSFEQAMLAMFLDVLVLLLFVYLCLYAFSQLPRFVQSIISLASIGVVFQILVLPVIYNFNSDPKVAQDMFGLSILLLVFVSWNLAVYAHIFKAAFGVRLPAAMVLTVCYILITMMARQIIFPEIN